MNGTANTTSLARPKWLAERHRGIVLGIQATLLVAGVAALSGADEGAHGPFAMAYLIQPRVWLGLGCLLTGVGLFALRFRFLERPTWLGDGQMTHALPKVMDQSLYFGWWETYPLSPWETRARRAGKAASIGIALGAIGAFLIGAYIGGVEWLPWGLLLGLLGVIVSVLLVAIEDDVLPWAEALPFCVRAWREAYIAEVGGEVGFLVVAKVSPAFPDGSVEVAIPWSVVTGFSEDKYWKAFGRTEEPPFKQDWNVIKTAPKTGAPVLVTESTQGDSHLYRLVTELTARLGPEAQVRYARERAAGRAEALARTATPDGENLGEVPDAL